MRGLATSEHIARTPEQVFAYMMDFSNAPRWRSLIRKMEVVGGGPVTQGSHILITIDLMGKIKQTISEIWTYDPPRRVGFRNTAQNITGQFEYVLEPEAGGTRVTLTTDIKPHGLAWLLLPFVFKSHRLRYQDQLARLKAVVEGPRT